MNSATDGLRIHWREIIRVFLKLGVMSYGGPAIMGMMQAEIQERRAWLTKERFIDGLALVNMLPGAGVTQLSIFLGYARAGWWGGLIAGLCFIVPAFFIMLALTLAYARYGAFPRCAVHSMELIRWWWRSSPSPCFGWDAMSSRTGSKRYCA